MKAKTKFDPQIIQQFFVDHTEKIVMGLVAALFLFFAWQSFETLGNRYRNTPDQLKQATNQALAKIQQGPATKKASIVCTFPAYAEMIDEAKKSIDPGLFPTPLGWYPKPIAPRKLRSAPEIFAVEQLRSSVGRGAIGKSDDSTSAAAGKRWVVVTGLVPYRKQLAEYLAQFQDAGVYNPAKDVPTYVGYIVQRAEVIPGDKREPTWSKPEIVINAARHLPPKWGGQIQEEIAESRFVWPPVTSPLPALLDGTWGNEVVSPPQIPVAQRNGDAAERPRSDMRRGPGGGLPPRGPGPVRGPGGGRATPAGAQPNVPDIDLIGGGNSAQPAAQPTATTEEPEGPEYYLLRYFDFNVQPQKQYQYRFFLLLMNPNYGLKASDLDEQYLGEPRVLGGVGLPVTNNDGTIDWQLDQRYLKWSAPCSTTIIPGDLRLLAGRFTPARNQQEISVEVRILKWLAAKGRDCMYSPDTLIRGTVLNFSNAPVTIVGGGKSKEDLSTDCILVDLDKGGEPRVDGDSQNKTAPGLMLVMDRSGNLVMHDELADDKEWRKAKEAENTSKEPGRPRPPPRGTPGTRDNTLDQMRGADTLRVRERGGH